MTDPCSRCSITQDHPSPTSTRNATRSGIPLPHERGGGRRRILRARSAPVAVPAPVRPHGEASRSTLLAARLLPPHVLEREHSAGRAAVDDRGQGALADIEGDGSSR
jgi:hypothetical protein